MKTRLLLAFLLSIVAGLQSMKAQEAYAVYTEDNTTLTFYYDNLRSSRSGRTFSLNDDDYYPFWTSSQYDIVSVVFDSSFANARPTTTMGWFFNATNLQTITGMEYLNTSEVTNMTDMFHGCESLTNLDVSHFNTDKVTKMWGMFQWCRALTSLDISSFNTSKVTDMSWMFNVCRQLVTIYVGNGWSTSAVTVSNNMFRDCTNLVGGAGTAYNSSHIDASYAHIDGGTSNPGYLTNVNSAVFDIWIAGTRVTGANRNNVLGNGTVSYDMGSNTLTLKNANITADEAYGLRSKMPLNIKLEGENSISVVWKSAVFFQKGSTNGTVTILGDGSLNVTSDYTPIIAQLDLVIKDGAKIKLESAGDYTGINGLSDGTQLPTLTLQGAGTELRAKGGSPGSLTDFRALNLSDGIEIQEPAGATFTPNRGVVKNGALVANQWVVIAGSEIEAYAVYTEDNTTLTFYYDNQRYSRAGETYSLLVDSEFQEWYLYESYTSVTQVVFDSSFANARPTTTNSWFYLMENLQSITGMEYLNTSEVTDMEWMFYGCKNLISLDLSHFNTEKVTTMRKMFADCMRLENLNVSSFNTTVVTDMIGMFDGCIALKSLDLSTFNTANVTNMSNMFNYCNLLETIYVGNGWSTAKVTSSSRMFYNCAFLVGGAGTTYNSSHIDASYAHIDGGTSNPGYLTNVNSAVFDIWIAGTRVTGANRNNVLGDGTVSFDMGSNTLTLKNANITADEAYGLRSKTPLNIKLEGENSISVVWKSAVFFQKGSINGTVTILGDGSLNVTSDNTPIIAQLDLVIKDGAKIKLESTGDYTGINGLSNGARLPTLTLQGAGTELRAKGGSPGSLTDFRALNLSDGIEIQEPAGATFTPNVGVVKNGALVANDWVVIAGSEPYACYTSSNTTLTFYYDNQRSSRTGTTYDLNEGDNWPGWKSNGTNANVTKVVFDPSFADARPTTTYAWFFNMKQLQTITCTEYLNTSEVTDMSCMFTYCESLTSLDLSNFNTSNVTDMSIMFAYCTSLTSLDLSSFNTANVTTMKSMFDNCGSLTSLDLNNFNTGKVTNMDFMFFRCLALESLNLSSFNTSNVTDMSYMFANCKALKSIDVSNFNTANVTTLLQMFFNCESLTSLDISSFNTDNVMDMTSMFCNCSNLETIYVGDGWSTAAVTYSNRMFNNCTSLIGGQGTTYDENHIDASYAHIDDCVNNPGYFTDKNAPVTYFTVDGIYYHVIGDNMVGVTYKAGYNTYRGMVEIPENVTFRDVTYAVKTIEDKAFYDCQNLSYLTIPSSVEIIGAQAFHNCPSLHTIVSYALNPPQLQYNSFDEEQYERVNVYVDLDYVLDYIYAPFWENFYVDTIDAIEDVNANVNLNDSWYDLQGRKIGKARKGIYIKDGRKVLIN